jgi:hypothetical protein
LPPTLASKGYIQTKDNGLIITPSTLTSTAKDDLSSPIQDAGQAAGFGDSISDIDRQFASEREPIGINLTYGVAADVTEKWFTVNDPDTEEADPALDRTVQDALQTLKFKAKLTHAEVLKRIYGWSLIVGAFTDAGDLNSLKKPLRVGSELKQLAVYLKCQVRVVESDENPMSPRYLQPVVYELNRGKGVLIQVHFSRTCLVCNEDSPTSTMLTDSSHSLSVLDGVWDDLTCGRNIRWGASQWMYRNGGGFPVIEFPTNTTVEQLQAYADSGAFSDLMARSYICIAQADASGNGMKFRFEGALGKALDPVPFFKSNLEQFSIATGIPQAKLVGAQAGALTGSEVNMQDYYKVISREQSSLEDTVRWVIDRLAESGQIALVSSSTATDKIRKWLGLASTPKTDSKLKRVFARAFGIDYRHKTARTYLVEWNSAFELSDKDEATIEDLHVRANQGKLDYMSKDEVRADEGLDPLPDGAGEWKDQPQGLQLFNQTGAKEKPTDPNNPNVDPKLKDKQGNPLNELTQNSDVFVTFAPRQQPQVHKHEHPTTNQ